MPYFIIFFLDTAPLFVSQQASLCVCVYSHNNWYAEAQGIGVKTVDMEPIMGGVLTSFISKL